MIKFPLLKLSDFSYLIAKMRDLRVCLWFVIDLLSYLNLAILLQVKLDADFYVRNQRQIDKLGGEIDLMSGIFDAIGSFQWETLFQLVCVALIMLAGPAVIFVLAFRNGDL